MIMIMMMMIIQVMKQNRAREAKELLAGRGSEAKKVFQRNSSQGQMNFGAAQLVRRSSGNTGSASKSSIRRFVITEKAPTRAFSWLKAATTAFTFKTLLRHYAKRALTPRSLNVKLGP